ncbi:MULTISPECIES: thioesterase family protein [unclassified Bradyrhizobium]|uniref:thioesterase family protein n=1 Tax=unclassified Bradyrhizobium TaxID=2631580 RepID=UPI0028ED3015|nr:MULTISPECIES: thioesterase family protein [unclassified Bradyrhizobium]
MTAVYQVTRNIAIPTSYAGGPWSPSVQHGAALAGLVTWAAEQIQVSPPMHIVRITIEFLRPAPIRAMEIKTDVDRAGRKAHMVTIRLISDGVELVRARVLRMRSADLGFPANQSNIPLNVSGPDMAYDDPEINENPNPFFSGVSMRFAREIERRPGYGAVWLRIIRSFIEGEQISPVVRAAIAADFTSGPSAIVDFNSWSYANSDLSIFLTRPPADDWILLNAEAWLGEHGTAIASSRLADARGYFGRATQTCLIEPRQL